MKPQVPRFHPPQRGADGRVQAALSTLCGIGLTVEVGAEADPRGDVPDTSSYAGEVDIPAGQLVPDDKDWTWVLERPCPECGLAAGSMPLDRAGDLLAAAVSTLRAAIGQPGARTRPVPATWSPLEYACHVRDTCEVFRERIALVLSHDDPTFDNWDQDATAVDKRYADQDPAAVATELDVALSGLLRQLNAVPEDAWDRPALRSNGSRFTLETLVRYLVHDPVHHAHDVSR